MNTTVSQTPARIVLGLMALALVGIFVMLNYFSQHDIQELVAAGERTTAVITTKDCGNHGKVNYTYAIEGKQYSGSSNFCVPSCEHAIVGEQVNIVFSKKDRWKSECGSLDEPMSRNNGNYLALLLIGVALFVVIYRITKV